MNFIILKRFIEKWDKVFYCDISLLTLLFKFQEVNRFQCHVTLPQVEVRELNRIVHPRSPYPRS